jgi:integrase
LLERYEHEVTPTKRGAVRERYAIHQLRKHRLAGLRLEAFSPAIVALYRDERLLTVCGTTLRRELAVLHHCLEIAGREWNLPISGKAVSSIRLPALPPKRYRRIAADAEARLWHALTRSGPAYLKPLVSVAIETGMRRGELLALRWSDIDMGRRTAWLERTKNGQSRLVPLSPVALENLASLPRSGDRVFPVSANAVRLAWERMRSRANVPGVRFHDLRHEAVSRFFEMGLTIAEVASVSGHSDLRMLGHYTHPSASGIAAKLNDVER